MRNRQLVSETVQSIGAILGFCLVPFVIVLCIAVGRLTNEVRSLRTGKTVEAIEKDHGPSGFKVGMILAGGLSFSCVMAYFTSQDGLTGPK